MTATTTAMRIQRYWGMGGSPGVSGRLLLGAGGGMWPRHRAPQALDPDGVGDLERDRLLAEAHDGADQSARRDDPVALLEVPEHLFPPLALALLGTDEKEEEDSEDQNHRDE